jgi:superfamily II DNA or RNA helicase/very-short-patch-repair endonuclease
MQTSGHPCLDIKAVNQDSPPAIKIALFQSLFRGRTDVYPVRFESRKTGKAGYSPACANEWVRGVCEKPRIKCTECSFRRFIPVTDEVIRWHLSGKNGQGQEFVIGLYPMLLDETCYFLAIDFDRQDWQDDASAFLETCRRFELPAALERSRSGNGGHVWIFFEQAIPAHLARKLGSYLLTETMERRPDLGFGSYDRLFPNQDTLPKAGFGNLIALPLQKRARELGNTVFLDGDFKPYSDQWAFLGQCSKIGQDRVELLVQRAETMGRIIAVRMVTTDDDEAPWNSSSWRRHEPDIVETLPDSLNCVLADQIYIARENLPAALRNRLLRLAAFQNPEFYRAQSMRLPTYDKPRVIHCAEEYPQHLALPRGCLDEVRQLLKELRIKLVLRDERCLGVPLETEFCGTLRPEQQAVAEALLEHEIGVLAATTAFGKTVVAAWLIAQRRVNTLVLVHRQQLLEQWVQRLSAFLDLPTKTIGRLGGGKKKLTGILDVALIQSLVRKGQVDDRIETYGHVIIDECHHVSARSFEMVVRRAKARFVAGLSATVTRKDGHHPIILMQCGPLRYRVDAKRQAAARPFAHQVIVRPTGFFSMAAPDQDPRVEFQLVCDGLRNDDARNEMICADVVNALNEGRSPLLLTERIEHLEQLAQRLSPQVQHTVVLHGGLGQKALRDARTRLAERSANAGCVILATGKYIGEGFDDPRLDTLFLTLPVSWRGTIAQYVGRLHRLHEGKLEVRVYDYADLNVPMLSRMFERRCRGYEALGYTLMLPASALPGWPVDVPLPVDPLWNKDYAGSVRRLVRDGVDTPLAKLFVHVARPFTPDAEGTARARSASEAFFYRRLETFPETARRFRLNEELPIPFDGWGRMEVDLLCADARLVIELDGAQHLSDPEAYRRDRRKDALLQQNGYFVLRFLAEDLGKRLDYVLDTVFGALIHQHGKGYTTVA